MCEHSWWGLRGFARSRALLPARGGGDFCTHGSGEAFAGLCAYFHAEASGAALVLGTLHWALCCPEQMGGGVEPMRDLS